MIWRGLIAGAKYRENLKKDLRKWKEVEKSDGNIVMFIDEIHTIVELKTDGAMDAGNIMKPALSRGLIKVIGQPPLMNTENILRRMQLWKEGSKRFWLMSRALKTLFLF